MSDLLDPKVYARGFEDGAQSRQAEIDALKAQRDEAVKLLREATQEGVSRDWLQRIDTFLGSSK